MSPSALSPDKRIASFAGAFRSMTRATRLPMVDEPKPTEKTYGFATAGWVVALLWARRVAARRPACRHAPRQTSRNTILSYPPVEADHASRTDTLAHAAMCRRHRASR